MQGVLICVSARFDSGRIDLSLVDLSECKDIDANFDNDIESALAYVKHVEANEIHHDMETAAKDEEEDYLKRLNEVEAMTWGEITPKGYYSIPSVWAGPLAEDGAEYRFFPVTR